MEGVQTADLRMGPGHYPGTPLPGEAGNASIAGHRTTYAHPFYDLNAVTRATDRDHHPAGDLRLRRRHLHRGVPDRRVGRRAEPRRRSSPSPPAIPRYSASSRLVLRATLVRSRLFPAGGRGGSAGGAPPPVRLGPAGRPGATRAGWPAPPPAAAAGSRPRCGGWAWWPWPSGSGGGPADPAALDRLSARWGGAGGAAVGLLRRREPAAPGQPVTWWPPRRWAATTPCRFREAGRLNQRDDTPGGPEQRGLDR